MASATTEAKRSFLIKKGLSAAEIDEGFRRAPAAPVAAPLAAPAHAAAPAAGSSPYAAPSQPGQQQVSCPQSLDWGIRASMRSTSGICYI